MYKRYKNLIKYVYLNLIGSNRAGPYMYAKKLNSFYIFLNELCSISINYSCIYLIAI